MTVGIHRAIIGSMDMTYSDFLKSGPGEPKKVYLLCGPEDALKRRAIETLISAFTDSSTRDFDLEILDGSGLSADKIITAASVVNLGSSRRMVIVNYANALPVEEQEKLAKAIPKLPGSGIIVLVEPATETGASGKNPKRGSTIIAALRNIIGKEGAIINFKTLTEEGAIAEAKKFFESHRKKTSPAVLNAFVSRVGEDVYVLSSEAAKVAAFAGEREVITLEDINAVTSAMPEERIWALVDAVGSRNVRKALAALEEIFESEGNPDKSASRILSMLARQLRLIWQMRYLLDVGINDPTSPIPKEIAQYLPADPNLPSILKRQSFNIKRYRQQAENFTPKELAESFEKLLKADLTLKGITEGPKDPKMIMELLTLDLCS